MVCPVDGARLVKLIVPADPHVGRELDGRYTVLEKVAAGGMGIVYRALQHSVDREVAIKVIHPSLMAEHSIIRRFLREARLASRLSHPNAVGVLDFGQTDDGLFYLVMEQLAGRTLDQVIVKDGLFHARRLLNVGIQVCDALEAAHALSIMHRDLKPANIMILDGTREFVKVLDFGLAKLLGAPDTNITGQLAGTPAFVPPERACGEPGDARSDLYSLGCILFVLGTGKTPFNGDSPKDMMMKHVFELPPPMTNVPYAIATIVDRLLVKNPDKRYQSAVETRAALEAALEELPNRTSASIPCIRLPSTPPVSDQIAFDVTRDESHSILDLVRVPARPRWPWFVAGCSLVAASSSLAFAIATRTPAPAPTPAPHAQPEPLVVKMPVLQPIVAETQPVKPAPLKARRPARPARQPTLPF